MQTRRHAPCLQHRQHQPSFPFLLIFCLIAGCEKAPRTVSPTLYPPTPYLAWEPSEDADKAGYYFSGELLGFGKEGFKLMLLKLDKLSTGTTIHIFMPYNSYIEGENPTAQIPFYRDPLLHREFASLINKHSLQMEPHECCDPKYGTTVPGYYYPKKK